MYTIHKFLINLVGVQIIEMPRGATLLDVQMQRGVPCLWALVDPDAPKTKRELLIFGTGDGIEDRPGTVLRHISTFQQDMFVWHVFERFLS